MITDLYIKKPEDPNYDPDQIIEEDELAMLIAQIKMILLTKKQSVLGDSTFGIDEESYLFTFGESVDVAAIQEDITRQLTERCTLLVNRTWNVETKLLPSELDPYKFTLFASININNNINFVIAYE